MVWVSFTEILTNVLNVRWKNTFVRAVASSPLRVSWLKIESRSQFLPVMEVNPGFHYFHYKKIFASCFYMVLAFFSITIKFLKT